MGRTLATATAAIVAATALLIGTNASADIQHFSTGITRAVFENNREFNGEIAVDQQAPAGCLGHREIRIFQTKSDGSPRVIGDVLTDFDGAFSANATKDPNDQFGPIIAKALRKTLGKNRNKICDPARRTVDVIPQA